MRRKIKRENIEGYTLLLPLFFLVLIFSYYPAVGTLITSFYFFNLKIPSKIKFVGFENYLSLLMDPRFFESLRVTIIFVATSVGLSTLLASLFALVLNKNFKGVKIVRTCALLPWSIPPMVTGFAWAWILNGSYGALNGFLYQLGIISKYISWLSDPLLSIFFAAVAQSWTLTPFATVVLLAGLQTIPRELYEAAEIDGAGSYIKFRYITFPFLSSSLALVLALTTVTSFLSFDIIYIMTGIDPRTRVLNILNYQIAFKDFDFGLGSALSYIILIIGMAIGTYYIKILYRRGGK